jgi:hypothetical protein
MTSESELKRQATGFAGEDIEFRQTRRVVANAKLSTYRAECWRLAGLARCGIVKQTHAVDLLYEVAITHALVRALGEDRIEAIIAEAFAPEVA